MLELPALFPMWIIGLADAMPLSLYQLSGTDLATLAAYFVTMGVLSVYGFHRYQLIYPLLQTPSRGWGGAGKALRESSWRHGAAAGSTTNSTLWNS